MYDSDTTRAELYVRSLAPVGTRDRQGAVVDRLRSLRRSGVLEDVDLTVWGDSVCLEGPNARIGSGRHIADRITAFRRWAEESDAEIEPFFEDTEVDSSMTGECFRRVVPPTMCLAVYADGELADVYPSVVDGDVRSVEDGLAELDRPVPESGARPMTRG